MNPPLLPIRHFCELGLCRAQAPMPLRKNRFPATVGPMVRLEIVPAKTIPRQAPGGRS